MTQIIDKIHDLQPVKYESNMLINYFNPITNRRRNNPTTALCKI